MSDGRRKTNKQSTGTVPKIKYRNNNNASTFNERGENPTRSWTSNNLAADVHRLNLTSDRAPVRHPNYLTMDPTTTTLEEQQNYPTNSLLNTNLNGHHQNGSVTSHTSSSNASRKNSIGTVPKCDNIKKYPDKRQIEDKLDQIRDYIQITKNLMSNMKNTDDQYIDQHERNNLIQMIKDLKDSEAKLVAILEHMNEAEKRSIETTENGLDVSSDVSSHNRNELIDRIDLTNHEIDCLREQQMLLLKQKAENKLKDARQIQDKLMLTQLDLNSNRRDKNLASEHEFDAAIKELEERTKRLKEPRIINNNNPNLQDQILNEVDSLHNQIINLHKVNEDRTQLIQILDNRDVELRTQHVELQSKLKELQNKKIQVDQLAIQLQSMDEDIENADDLNEDVSLQVKRIVTMKDQLTKLKDMLEIVKTTEQNAIQQRQQEEEIEQAMAANQIYTKAENFLQKDNHKSAITDNKCLTTRIQNVDGNLRNSCGSLINNEPQHGFNKQINNKNVCDRQLALQAELEAKKKELEEIMGKHKAGTSNLNHDVGGIDNKSEFSVGSNALFDGVAAWAPISSTHNKQHDSSDKYSSDECPDEGNDYSELNTTTHHHHNHSLPLSCINFQSTNTEKRRSGCNSCSDYVHSYDYDRLSSVTRTPERNVCNSSVDNASSKRRERGVRMGKNEYENKNQVQKQLELIRSVCDSMLEQQNKQPTTLNVTQQLRNNLTPSPLYSEPRFSSPNAHSMNALNVVTTTTTATPNLENQHQWLPNNNNLHSDPQNWLATNTLPTQAFMLNTLNQCCQMLWLQQRELNSLRQTINQFQERLDNPHFDNSSHLTSPLQLNSIDSRSSNQYRCAAINNQQKINQQQQQQHVTAACSMPNLNQYNIAPVNIDPSSYIQNHNNLQQNARLLDSCLNNHLNTTTPATQDHNINNSVLHGVNAANINQNLPPQNHQISWNGQVALNNQVAPGNRANNYWDNFRSYSRQNLLSTKSNEGLQNIASSLERSSNIILERTNPFSLMSLSKSNPEEVARNTITTTTTTTTTHDNVLPRRSTAPATTIQRSDGHNNRNITTTTVPVVPPDVLNINPNTMIKTNELLPTTAAAAQQQQPVVQNNSNLENELNSYQIFLNNAFAYNETSSNNSTLSEDLIFKDCISESTRRRNEWNDEQNEEQLPMKSKLFEELRENVYREVATLISANEARPHFLIQLFKDLQMISSDPLRLKILQSIQSVITHSLSLSATGATAGINRQNATTSQQQSNNVNEQNLPTIQDCFSLQSTVWSKSIPHNMSSINARNTLHLDNNNTNNNEIQNALQCIIPYLNDHEDEIIQHNFINSLKQMLIESESFQDTVKDTIFQKHFSNVLDDVLIQYIGKKVHDIKMHLIQTINDLLRGELSFIQLIQETCPEKCDSDASAATTTTTTTDNTNAIIYEQTTTNQLIDNNIENGIENGDLAEADQLGRVEDDEIEEEEGAVGGLWEIGGQQDQAIGGGGGGGILSSKITQVNSDDVDLVTIEFHHQSNSNVESQTQFIKQGLDQVPTRLPTKSRSNTPSKDRSSSSRSDHTEQF